MTTNEALVKYCLRIGDSSLILGQRGLILFKSIAISSEIYTLSTSFIANRSSVYSQILFNDS